MSNIVELTIAAPNRREVERYLGVKSPSGEIDALISRAVELVQPYISPRAAYRIFDVNVIGEECDLGFATVTSHSLAINLNGCRKIALVCATAGIEIDRLIKRYINIQPSLAHAISAVGSERVEAIMDAFVDYLSKSFGEIRPRFSAGYGDLDLSLQRDVFSSLCPERTLGITLSDSLLMSPSKSVSAIVGIV